MRGSFKSWKKPLQKGICSFLKSFARNRIHGHGGMGSVLYLLPSSINAFLALTGAIETCTFLNPN